MGKFTYKFESIMKVKETFEKKVQKEISLLDIEIDNMNKSIKALMDEKEKFRNSLTTKKNIKVSELQFYNDVENLLEIQVKKLFEGLTKLKVAKEHKMNELVQKIKEHKMFEVLKEKHYENYILFENQVEQKEIDEIATKRFARGE
ncbi:MAG: flagellar export protein FliJ [Ignavibacteria bacterium]